jgi:drug/metabolite transporter (DMT)-like permease
MTHRQAVLLMVVATLLWSIAGVVTRHLDAARSFEVTFWRSVVNAATLATGLLVLRGPALWNDLVRAPREIWISGACWGSMYTAFMVALTQTTVANVLVVQGIGPLVTALFARMFLGHRLPVRTWVAIAIGGVGIAWMFGQEAASGASLLGSLIAIVVPVASAVNFTVLQYIGHGSGDPDSASAPVQDMLPGILVGATLSALVTLPLAWPLQASAHDIGLLSLLGVVQLAIPCFLVVRISRVLPAPEIALLCLLETLFGVTWAWIFAGESPGANALTGGALVLAALVANEALALRQARARR